MWWPHAVATVGQTGGHGVTSVPHDSRSNEFLVRPGIDRGGPARPGAVPGPGRTATRRPGDRATVNNAAAIARR